MELSINNVILKLVSIDFFSLAGCIIPRPGHPAPSGGGLQYCRHGPPLRETGNHHGIPHLCLSSLLSQFLKENLLFRIMTVRH